MRLKVLSLALALALAVTPVTVPLAQTTCAEAKSTESSEVMKTSNITKSIKTAKKSYKMLEHEKNWVNLWYKELVKADEENRYKLAKDHYGTVNSMYTKSDTPEERELFPDAPRLHFATVSDAVDIKITQDMYITSESQTEKPITVYFKGPKIKRIVLETDSSHKYYYSLKAKKNKGYVTSVTIKPAMPYKDIKGKNYIHCYGKNNKKLGTIIYSQTLIGQD